MKIFTIKNKLLNITIQKVGIAFFWLAIWQVLYLIVKQEILIVSPVRVFQRMSELIWYRNFWISTLYSMIRVITGYCLAVFIGTFFAILASFLPFVYKLFQPILGIIKATPVASFIILALVWIPNSNVPIFTSFLMVLPIVLENVLKGFKNTDKSLLEMASVFHFGVKKTVRHIYIPSIMPYFMAACTTGMGFAWKAGIAAEVLSSTKYSIGGNIYDAKIYLETADLFAWTVVVVVMSVILERVMIKLMKAAWRKYNIK